MASNDDLQPDELTQTMNTNINNQDKTRESSSPTRIPDIDYSNKQSNPVSTQDHGNSLPNESQLPAVTTETSTFELASSDATKQPTTDSTKEHGNSLPTEIQQETTSEPFSSQVPDSHDPSKIATSNVNEAKKDKTLTHLIKKVLFPIRKPKKKDTTEIKSGDLEPNKGNTINEPTPDNLETNKDSPRTHDQDRTHFFNPIKLLFPIKKPKKDTTEIESGDLEPNKDNSTKEPDIPDDMEPNKDNSMNEPNPDQERTHLFNLISKELDYLKRVCPNLGRLHQQLTEEIGKADQQFLKLQVGYCDLKELKDLKRSITKFKLQVPAIHRTYDDKDQQKNQNFFVDNRISPQLLNILPRLHNNLFHQSLFCKTMQQRYNDLRLELKLCLLCFSVFPENEEISRRLMVYWWIAEGLIPSGEDDYGKTLEDRANEYFIELMDKDFIEPAASTSPVDRHVATCKMQPMIRAALVMISDRIKFFDFDEFGNPKDFGRFDEIESPEEMPDIYPLGDPREFFEFFDKKRQPIPKDDVILFSDKGNPIPFAAYEQESNKVILDRNGNVIDSQKPHYFYRKIKNIKMNSYKACLMGTGLPKGLSWEKIHMLFNVKDDILVFKPDSFLKMQNINLLILGRWQSSAGRHIEVVEFKIKESLEYMKHVRFFSLQGVSRITELPESISNLESLLILDLRACHNLEKIPKTIGLLKYLTHLDISECYLLKDIPKEISSLVYLQVLKGFVVVDSQQKHVCTLEDLHKLENLRKLSMYTRMKDFPKDTHLYALQNLKELLKLTILWGGHELSPKKHQTKQDNVALPMLSNMCARKKRVQGSMKRMNAFFNSTIGLQLEKLDLKCFPDKRTPSWLTPGSLKGLKKLYIRGGEFSDIGQYQDIYEYNDSLNIPKVETWNVKVLRLKYLNELKMEWGELQKLFPKMTYLEKVKCPKLTLFPCNERGVWIDQEPSISG
uniref:uncharacterized protein LOC122583236 n=1 Tax=Erigeron canadensis TaxID=72917 RepID=UPI001CB979FE|nr:uncharacterized protein LOC122583236 [Erigeron canadensis]